MSLPLTYYQFYEWYYGSGTATNSSDDGNNSSNTEARRDSAESEEVHSVTSTLVNDTPTLVHDTNGTNGGWTFDIGQ